MATSSNGIIQLLNEITDFDHGFHPEFVEIVDSQDLRGIRAPHYHKNNFGKLANDIKFNKFMRDTWTKNLDLQKLDRRKIEALWFKTLLKFLKVYDGPKKFNPKNGMTREWWLQHTLDGAISQIYDHPTHKFWEEKCHAAGAQMSYPNPDDENNPFADQRWAVRKPLETSCGCCGCFYEWH